MRAPIAFALAGLIVVLAAALILFVRPQLEPPGASFAGGPAARAAPPSSVASALPIDSQVTFLYYEDLEAAAAFYEVTLRLERTYDAEGARIYRTSATSYVGLVRQGSGYHDVAESKPVMVSIVTDAVDDWYEHLSAEGVKILSELSDSTRAPVRAFLVEDPGGYTVEFFQWRDR